MSELAARPMLHFSRELDHFYGHELNVTSDEDIDAIGRRLVTADIFSSALILPKSTESSVVLIDTYNTETRPEKRLFRPVDALKTVITAARRHNVRLDYIALEGGFAPIAQEVFDQHIKPSANIIEDTTRDSSVWLYGGSSNDKYTFRSTMPPEDNELAIISYPGQREVRKYEGIEAWARLFTYKTNRRGNVKLQNGEPTIDKWACAYLAAMFLAARLGSIKHPRLTPELIDPDNPPDYDQYSEYSTVLQVNPDAQPFVADRAFSYLSTKFLGTEHGVSIIAEEIDSTIPERHNLATYGSVVF